MRNTKALMKQIYHLDSFVKGVTHPFLDYDMLESLVKISQQLISDRRPEKKYIMYVFSVIQQVLAKFAQNSHVTVPETGKVLQSLFDILCLQCRQERVKEYQKYYNHMVLQILDFVDLFSILESICILFDNYLKHKKSDKNLSNLLNNSFNYVWNKVQ